MKATIRLRAVLFGSWSWQNVLKHLIQDLSELVIELMQQHNVQASLQLEKQIGEEQVVVVSGRVDQVKQDGGEGVEQIAEKAGDAHGYGHFGDELVL